MKRNHIITICSFLAVLFIPATVFATYGLDASAGAAGLTGAGTSIPAILGNIVGTALSLIGIVFFILVVYGGFMWMTSGGNQDNVKKSINTIISAALGLVVVLAAYAITNFALGSLGATGGGGGGGGGVPTPGGGFIFSDVGEACERDNDCALDLECSTDGECVEIGGGGFVFGGLGDACGSDDDCTDDLECTDSECVEIEGGFVFGDEGDACDSTDECAFDLECTDGTCSLIP